MGYWIVYDSWKWSVVKHVPSDSFEVLHLVPQGGVLKSDRYYGLLHSRVLKANVIPDGEVFTEFKKYPAELVGSSRWAERWTSFAFKGWVRISAKVIWLLKANVIPKVKISCIVNLWPLLGPAFVSPAFKGLNDHWSVINPRRPGKPTWVSTTENCIAIQWECTGVKWDGRSEDHDLCKERDGEYEGFDDQHLDSERVGYVERGVGLKASLTILLLLMWFYTWYWSDLYLILFHLLIVQSPHLTTYQLWSYIRTPNLLRACPSHIHSRLCQKCINK